MTINVIPQRLRLVSPAIALRSVDVVSTLATRASFLVMAWLALTTTQVAWQVGAVVAAQAAAYIACCPAGATLVDRYGVGRASVGADLLSAVAVALVAFGGQQWLLLLALGVPLGALRAVSDRAKEMLVGPVDEEPPAAAPAREGLVRLSSLVVGAAAGAVVVLLAPTGALWLLAMIFTGCAGALVVRSVDMTAPDLDPDPGPGLGVGDAIAQPPAHNAALAALRRDRVVRRLVVVLLIATMLSSAGAVALVGAWDRDVVESPASRGFLAGVFVLGLLGGGLVAASLIRRSSRLAVLAAGYLVGGGSIMVVRGVRPALLVVVVAALVAGVALASVTPAVSTVLSQRTPAALRSRVGGFVAMVTCVGIPLGTILAAWLLSQTSEAVALGAGAGLYAVTMLIPVFARTTWLPVGPRPAEAVVRSASVPRLPARVSVTLAYADGQWLVEVRRGRSLLGTRHPIQPAAAMSMLTLLDVPGVHAGIEQALTTDHTEAVRQVERMRGELAELEAKLHGLNEMVERSEPRQPG
jgi:hypothetical protein